MFPDTNDRPARGTKELVCVRIAAAICFELIAPPIPIRPRPGPSIGHPCQKHPSTTRDLRAGKDQVGAPPHARQGPKINPVTTASSWSAERTACSGAVSRRRVAFMRLAASKDDGDGALLVTEIRPLRRWSELRSVGRSPLAQPA